MTGFRWVQSGLLACVTTGQLLVAVAPVWAQAPASPAAPIQEIRAEDLAGLEIDATVVQLRDVVTNVGRGKQRATHVWRLTFGADGQIDYSQRNIILKIAKGESDTRTHRAKTVLGQPHTYREGKAVMVLENGTLTLLRTQADGGQLVKFALVRASTGFACKINQAMARENGTGSLRTTSTTFGMKWVKFENSREVSNSCKVRKTP